MFVNIIEDNETAFGQYMSWHVGVTSIILNARLAFCVHYGWDI